MVGAIRVALLVLLAAACAPSVDGLALNGTAWRAVTVNGAPPVAGREPTLVFNLGEISGSAGCNGYGSQNVKIEGHSITIRDLGMTAVACGGPDGSSDNPIMRTEMAFYRALSAATTIGLGGGRLVIAGPEGELVFVGVPVGTGSRGSNTTLG